MRQPAAPLEWGLVSSLEGEPPTGVKHALQLWTMQNNQSECDENAI